MITDLPLVALVTVAAWALPVLSRPTLPFGVRVPGDRVTAPEITAQRRRHARGVLVLGAIAALAVVLGAPSGALLILGAADMALYYTAHRAVAAAKRRGDWYAGTKQATSTDTAFRTDPVRVPWPLLLPSLLLVAVTATIGVWRYSDLPANLATLRGLGVDAATRVPTTPASAFATVAAQVAVTLVAPVVIAALLRSRPDLDAEYPEASAYRYRVYLRGMSRLLLLVAACLNLTLLLLALRQWQVLAPSAGVTVATWLPPIAAGIAMLVFGVRVGEAGHRLPVAGPEAGSGYVQRDDDRYWRLAGMVYANRDDPAIMVHQRVGGRWTLNLGNPVVWMGIAVVAFVAGLAMTPWPH
ncbi:DUF5808 domain-containing protein [Sphaerisporangium sp. TRM90804]|uniref:DUF1648 domain-containing protein n=1 Tax=Sphaerisporangium sp. TRM90804 TaxID=3031113 RepID=UPI00244B5732|nr:DUF5808 domain-containing protein [Sphaerisporangium sp. TRM90804]MDH2430557.1 hypothetical protein [Sphaerisporangium sp. TRM90804]